MQNFFGSLARSGLTAGLFSSDLLFSSRNMAFYAVARGKTTGIFETWSQCESQVKGFKNPAFKKFKTRSEAEDFLKSHSVTLPTHLNKPKALETPKPPPPADFWAEGADCDEIDNDYLLAASAEVEGVTKFGPTSVSTSLKRKLPPNENSSSRSKHKCTIWEPIGLRKYGSFEFPIDAEGFVIAYTDGSCEGNGQKNAVAGFGVYFDEGHPLNAAKPVIGRVTNNAGEIQAAIHAIQIAKDNGIAKLCISTDSQFVINSVTQWIGGWKRKGWKTASGAPVKNVEDFQRLDALMASFDVNIKWNYVKGHGGILGNERADRLARQGAQMYRDQKTNKGK